MPRAPMPPALVECDTPLATHMAQLLVAHRLHSKGYVQRGAGTPDTYVCDTCGIEIVQEWTHGGLATYQLRHQSEQIAAWITAHEAQLRDAMQLKRKMPIAVCGFCGKTPVVGSAPTGVPRVKRMACATCIAQRTQDAQQSALAFSRMTDEQVMAVLGGEQLQLWD